MIRPLLLLNRRSRRSHKGVVATPMTKVCRRTAGRGLCYLPQGCRDRFALAYLCRQKERNELKKHYFLANALLVGRYVPVSRPSTLLASGQDASPSSRWQKCEPQATTKMSDGASAGTPVRVATNSGASLPIPSPSQ
jgi:hypothetical protein